MPFQPFTLIDPPSLSTQLHAVTIQRWRDTMYRASGLQRGKPMFIIKADDEPPTWDVEGMANWRPDQLDKRKKRM